jgi:hypothetical protein
MALVRRNTLAGAPIHYDRFQADGSDYGTLGKPWNPYIDPSFYDACERAFNDIQTLLHPRLGAFKAVVCGGVGRAGGGASYHHQHRAFDLDALFWESGAVWVANTFEREPHLYLAIESQLRLHFGTVLTYLYNRAHEDHFHFDDGRRPNFRSATKTHSLFVQTALKYVFAMDVGVDGVWGPETDGAARAIRTELGIGPFSKLDNWLAFCRETGKAAAALVDAPTPAAPAPGCP